MAAYDPAANYGTTWRVGDYSPEKRFADEVRHVADMRNNAARKAYLIGVAEKRGEAAAQMLRNAVVDLIRERK